MSSTIHDQERTSLQAKLDSMANGKALRLPLQEYPGPIEIKHPVTLDGQGATFWAFKGPVLTISSPGVTLCKLKIEATGGTAGSAPADTCALYVKPGCGVRLQDVEVRGSVVGVPQEEGEWRLPSSLRLGSLPLGVEHQLVMRVYVPVPCSISSNISGLDVPNKSLTPGRNEVTLGVEQLPADTLLNGVILIKTANLIRCIPVNAHISGTRPKKPSPKSRTKTIAQAPKVVWQPDDWDVLPATPVVTHPDIPDPGDVRTLPPGEPFGQPNGQGVVEDYIPVSSRPSAPPLPVPDQVDRDKPGGGTGQEPQPKPQPQPQPKPQPQPQPPTPGPTPQPQPAPVPRSSRRYLYIGLGAVGLIVLALTFKFLFMRGATTLDPQGVTLKQSMPLGDAVSAVAFSPDSKMLAAAGGGKVKLFDASDGSSLREMPKPGESVGAITSLAFSPDGKTLAAGTDGANIYLFDAQTGSKLNTLRGHTSAVGSVAFSPDGLLVAGAGDNTVKVWEVKAVGGSPKQSFPPLDAPVTAVAFSPDGATLASATQTGVVKLWGTSDWAAKPEISKRGTVITSLAFSPDGKYLAAGTADATLVIWDVQTRSLTNTLRGHHQQVNSVAYWPDGKWLVSGAEDGSVFLWDPQKVGVSSPERPLVQHAGPVKSVAVSPDGSRLAGGGDKSVALWANK